VGGTLLACVLGPEAAMLTVTSILVVQSLIFQDGGVLALGANIFNMALCGVLAGYLPYAAFGSSSRRYLAVFAGGVLSVMVSGVLALTELVISGIRIPSSLLLLSGLLFLANAVMEGAITTTVLRGIERLTPEAPTAIGPNPARFQRAIIAAGLAALVLGALGLLVASTAPDGLEHLAARLGLVDTAAPIIRSPLADYQWQALGGTYLSRATAGLTGIFIIYTACLLGSRLLARVRRTYSS
jgi:cobalt/nickel transport system permease protein